MREPLVFLPKIALFYTTFLPQFIDPGDPVMLLSIGRRVLDSATGGVLVALGIRVAAD